MPRWQEDGRSRCDRKEEREGGGEEGGKYKRWSGSRLGKINEEIGRYELIVIKLKNFRNKNYRRTRK